MASDHRFPYRWRLADGYPAKGVEYHGCKVFGTFVCGGGSTMGYKLAGFKHLGGVEIDPRAAAVYAENHHPETLYIEDLRDFNKRNDLPPELYDLDILDGSPPCSTFSMAGSREKAWGKKKVFREGQKEQTLDDLVFVYCDTIAKLRPRVCLLENVAGLVRGNARSYCKRIIDRLRDCGYERTQVFLLNAATMGVPQTRVRTFFIGLRDDLPELPKLVIDINEPPILFGEIRDKSDTAQNMTPHTFGLWQKRSKSDLNFGDINRRIRNTNSCFANWIIQDSFICPTVTSGTVLYLYETPRHMNALEILTAQTFPSDYKANENLKFYCGMSVAPVQMAHIASAIYEQWLKPIRSAANAPR